MQRKRNRGGRRRELLALLLGAVTLVTALVELVTAMLRL